jgi:outer membrane receptor for ferrienterochelin and colicins
MDRTSRRRLHAAMVIAWSVMTVPAGAEDQTDVSLTEGPGPAQFSLEKIEYVEQRHQGLQQRHDSNISKVIITREDIVQFRDRRAGDVLRRMPGLFMGGPPGENRDVRLRGLDKEYTQILINGERIAGGGEKREFELDRIPTDMIERIEIIKNPSAEYGSDAVAGIVNIVLRGAPNRFSFDGLIGAGGPTDGRASDKYLGDQNAVFNMGNTMGKVGWRFGGSFFRNLRTTEKEKLKTNFDRELDHEYVPTESLDTFGEMVWTPTQSDRFRLTPFLLYREEDKGRTKDTLSPVGAVKSAEHEREFKVLREPRITAAWDHRYADGALLEWSGTLNLHEEEKLKTLHTGTKPGGTFTPTRRSVEKEIKRDTDQILNLNYRQPYALFDMRSLFSTGTKIWLKDRTKDKSKLDTTLATGVTANTTGAKDNYAIDQRNFGFFASNETALTDRLYLTAGVRAELIDGELTDKRTGQTQRTPLTTDLTPSIHVVFRPFDATNIRASFAQAVRRPQFDQLIPSLEETPTQFKLGNPNLRPEKSNNYELQVEQFWPNGILSAGIYYRELRDKQEEVIIGRSGAKDIVQFSNVGNGTLWGAEFEAMRQLDFLPYEWMRYFRLRANLTWTISSKVTDPDQRATRRFKDTPTHIINVILEYLHPDTGIGLNVGMNQISERIDPKTDGTFKIEDTLRTLDVSVTKTLGRNVSLFFDARNVTFAESRKTDKGEFERQSIPTRFFFGLKWFY